MKTKQKVFSDPTSIYGIDRIMPIDFIFLLLYLINYPDPFPHTIIGKQFYKLRFERLDQDNCMRFLINLKAETGIGLTLNRNSLIKEITVTAQSIKNIQIAIDNYLKLFLIDELIPIHEDCRGFKEQKKYFLDILQRKLAKGVMKKFFLADNEIEKEYRIFESALVLERQGYIKIENIRNFQNPNEKSYYKILISANKEKIYAREKVGLPQELSESIQTAPHIVWKHVFMRIRETFDITIRIGELEYKTTCEKMGFQDKRSPGITKMKKCLKFLCLLAMKNGIVDISKESLAAKQEWSKRKQELAKILKKFFPSIVGDPFEKYIEADGYKIKFKVEPEIALKEKQYRDRDIHDPVSNKRNPYADLEEEYKKETPFMFE